jgi:hypothetical protein
LQALVHFATEVGDQGICQRFLFVKGKRKRFSSNFETSGVICAMTTS